LTRAGCWKKEILFLSHTNRKTHDVETKKLLVSRVVKKFMLLYMMLGFLVYLKVG
jgi:hypothetical protein